MYRANVERQEVSVDFLQTCPDLHHLMLEGVHARMSREFGCDSQSFLFQSDLDEAPREMIDQYASIGVFTPRIARIC